MFGAARILYIHTKEMLPSVNMKCQYEEYMPCHTSLTCLVRNNMQQLGGVDQVAIALSGQSDSRDNVWILNLEQPTFQSPPPSMILAARWLCTGQTWST